MAPTAASPGGMGPTAASPGVEPRRGRGRAAVAWVLVAGAVAAIGGVALVVAQQGGDRGRSRRDPGAAEQPPSEAPREAVVGGSVTGNAAGTANVALPTTPRMAAGSSGGGTVKSGTAGGAATAAATAQPTAAASAPRPFDYAAATSAVQRAGGNAKVHCKGKEGPKAVSATIFFNPNGAVQRVGVDPMIASKPSALCVSMTLSSVRVPPFDGKDLQPYPTTVGIE